MEKGKIIIKRMIIGFMTVVMTFAGMNITPVQAAAKVELVSSYGQMHVLSH